MRPRKILLSALTVALLSAFAAVPAPAASKQKIGSVRLNAKNRIETGGSITRDGVVQGDPAKGELGVWVNADSYQLESVRVTGGVGDNLPVGSVISVEAVLRTTDSDRSFSQTLSESDVHLSDNAGKVTELPGHQGRFCGAGRRQLAEGRTRPGELARARKHERQL